jgi:hypothetical protein
MKTILLLFILLTFTVYSYSQTVINKNDSTIHCVQLLFTDNYVIIEPEILATFPDNTLVEEIIIKGDLYYRLMLICKNQQDQVETYLKYKNVKNYKTLMTIRNKNQVDKMTNLFTFD